MKPIQFILIPAFIGLLIYFEHKLKKQVLLKLFLWAVLLGGMFFTIFHEWSTPIANLVGIGRGVDLIMYLSLLGLTTACTLLYLRTVKLERQLTALVRQQALERGTSPEKSA